jgi:tetratricopeptide (TPR) repeat protein
MLNAEDTDERIMKYLLLALSILLVSACSEGELTLRDVCEKEPGLCSDLNDDSHCNVQRRDLIMQRFEEKRLPSDKNKYQLLVDLEKYSKCIELAAGIEHIKLKEKTSTRMVGYMTSLKEIKRLNDETISSDNPLLLYYHWSRNKSDSHLQRFLQAEKDNRLETPQLQMALVSYYSKRDREKSIRLLHHALELYPANPEIDPEIYAALTSIFYKKKDYATSYHWALLAQQSGAFNVELQELKIYLEQAQLDHEKIKEAADHTLAQLQLGHFTPPKF